MLSGNVFAERPVKPAATPMYEIGLPGPAGGIVFYISDGGGNRIRGRHGMEAAPVDQGMAPWGCAKTEIRGAEGTEIGTGAQNTQAILSQCTEPGTAAAIADSYELNGYTDWYLPSLKELVQLYNTANKHGVGGNTYMSSTATTDFRFDPPWSVYWVDLSTNGLHDVTQGYFASWYSISTEDFRKASVWPVRTF